jgi:arylsulfatase
MWAFGPAQRIVQQHLKTFEEWPPASKAASKNSESLDEKLESTGGVGQ